jgi:choline dehydrogenase
MPDIARRNPRVRGLARLRVIDTSVTPTVTSTDTIAPTIMIAEKGYGF